MGSVASSRAERDPDGDDEIDALFDEADDIFEDDEADEEQEGIFRDKTSIFSSPHSRPEDHHNPLITKEQEVRQWETPKKHAPVPPPVMIDTRTGAKRQLVAKFDAAGQPLVAKHVGGKQTEPFRRPTRDEHEKLRTKGRLVKGGVGAAPAPAAPAPGMDWKKIAMWAGGLAAAGYGGWWLWKQYNRTTKATSEEA